MKKLIILFLMSLFIKIAALSQPCLPQGISFATQEQIDNFQINHPNCTEVEGDVNIGTSQPNDDIINLNGLNVLTAIGGGLIIHQNHALTSLSGLDNVVSIGGNFTIYDNEELTSFTGLGNLMVIGGDIKIGIFAGIGNTPWGNPSLTNISALNSLEAVTGDLLIVDNPLLSNLSGLQNINTVVGDIILRDNHLLNNLSGLNSVISIQGFLGISQNQSLENLIGLENLISIEGGLWIGGLGRDDSPDKLKISNNPSLTSLEGINNLTTIGGDLYLGGNDVLINLDGLENLNSIGGQLQILGNSSLNSLTGLQNLTSVGIGLRIWQNDALSNLSGLDNINPTTIINLEIEFNDLLSSCEVQSICDYLSNPNGEVSILINAPGCNSQGEVEEACLTSIKELSHNVEFTISPNPCSGSTNLRLSISDQQLVICDLFEVSGVKIKSLINEVRKPGIQEIEIDLCDIPSGIYFCVLKTNPAHAGQTRKMIKL